MTTSTAYTRAIAWAETPSGSMRVPNEMRALFADGYAAMIDEIPATRYPDSPLPEPKDFADEFLLDDARSDLKSVSQ